MTTTTNTQAAQVETSAVPQMSLKDLTALVIKLQAEVTELKSKTVRSEADREMTDDDARKIMTGELKDMKHKDAASKLGLSYGQVYSCRLGYTFKAIHKEMKAANIANPWIK